MKSVQIDLVSLLIEIYECRLYRSVDFMIDLNRFLFDNSEIYYFIYF